MSDFEPPPKDAAKGAKKKGRPVTFTQKTIDAFLEALEQGVPIEPAAKAAGSSKASVNRRRRSDPKFAAAVEAAVAKGEAALVRSVRASDDWRAHAWLLERRFRKRWTKPGTPPVETKPTAPAERYEPPEQLAADLAATLLAQAGEAEGGAK